MGRAARGSLVARPPRPLIMSASAIEEDDPWLHQPILRPWRRLDWPKCGLGLGPAASSPSPHADECVVAVGVWLVWVPSCPAGRESGALTRSLA